MNLHGLARSARCADATAHGGGEPTGRGRRDRRRYNEPTMQRAGVCGGIPADHITADCIGGCPQIRPVDYAVSSTSGVHGPET
eukprot:3239402-Pleurochrysis_carterae.AAC.1